MQINAFNFNDPKQVTTLDIPAEIYEVQFKEGLIHEVMVSLMHNRRQGSKAQKSRSQVSGGGAKPWRQKGTGRARAGSIRSTIWRKGGVAHAASPRVFAKKINKKAYRLAMKSALAELNRQERLKVLTTIELSTHKTKDFINLLSTHDVERNCLIVVKELNDNLVLATRNVPKVTLLSANQINLYDLVSHGNILVAQDAFNSINGALLS